jgi:hypothetical protein
MLSVRVRKYLCLSFLLSAIFGPSTLPQKAPDFSGDWTLKLGNRVFLIVAVSPMPDEAESFGGSLIRAQHFSSSNGVTFSGVKGPVIRYPIVKTAVKENCLSFTTQNPADANDKDDFQLCITSEGQGTLKIDLPNFDGWPVTKEKGPLAVATDWDSTCTYSIQDTNVSNSQMKMVFDEDQKVREPGIGKIDWTVVEKTDAARREITRKLLADGKLHSGEDFEEAAYVFQHGDSSDDYLLAHTLAMVAVARGKSSAIWIATATLDRYLNSIHQPQIYGTQFYTKPNEPTTQEPYNRGLISDALRRQLNVPSQAAQEEQRRQYEKERARP